DEAIGSGDQDNLGHVQTGRGMGECRAVLHGTNRPEAANRPSIDAEFQQGRRCTPSIISCIGRLLEGIVVIRVFIGFDPREAVAFNVLSHSIHARSSQPVAIAPLALGQLTGLMTRERHPLQSTDFSFSRFLTPYLSGYSG